MFSFIRYLVNDFVSLCDEYSGVSSGKPSNYGELRRLSFENRPHFVPRPTPRFVPPPVPVPRPIPVQPQFHPMSRYHGSSLETVEEREGNL